MSEQELMTECAKEVAKEVYQDGGKPVVKATGSLLGLVPRAIKAAFLPLEKWIVGREYNLAETEKLLQLKLENISPDQIESPEAHIAVPALQYISYCMDNEELRNMYANLLANSMNSAVKNGVHPSFVEIIKQLCPDEAKILRQIYMETSIPVITIFEESKDNVCVDIVREFSDIGERSQCEFPLKIDIYFDNLARLGLIQREPHGIRLPDRDLYNNLCKNQYIQNKLTHYDKNKKNKRYRLEEGIISISSFGEAFCRICLDTHPREDKSLSN